MTKPKAKTAKKPVAPKAFGLQLDGIYRQYTVDKAGVDQALSDTVESTRQSTTKALTEVIVRGGGRDIVLPVSKETVYGLLDDRRDLQSALHSAIAGSKLSTLVGLVMGGLLGIIIGAILS